MHTTQSIPSAPEAPPSTKTSHPLNLPIKTAAVPQPLAPVPPPSRQRFPCLVVRYSELKSSLEEQVHRIAAFLHAPVAQWAPTTTTTQTACAPTATTTQTRTTTDVPEAVAAEKDSARTPVKSASRVPGGTQPVATAPGMSPEIVRAIAKAATFDA